ncbi:hypothetical protein [Flammeovirga sp. SJP92]|uniref:hypothetical protein n=1 Tax=Flammeovirga sp. SJP92 TaxID=1775430 RepID=UPI0007883943|nr:hypothetical protein [Flammeovirga sp. SJP92]KXX70052.1 hypothetical protein AVL50_14355 [Flammeovirga sp. SJP92]
MLKTLQHIFYFTFALFFGCQSSTIDKEAIIKEVSALDTIEKREWYLLKVLEEDQKVRNATFFQEVVTKYGTDSPEYQELGQKMMDVDQVNQYKIDVFIRQHGFPSPENYTGMAIRSPFFVYQHITDIDKRNNKAVVLYRAYQNGKIDIDLFNLYLGRTYFHVFGKNLVMENPYTSEQELEELIKTLDLAEKLK